MYTLDFSILRINGMARFCKLIYQTTFVLLQKYSMYKKITKVKHLFKTWLKSECLNRCCSAFV